MYHFLSQLILTEGSAQTIWRNIYVIICNNPDWRALKTFGTNCVHSTGIASASAVPPDRHCFTVICLSPFLIQTKQQFKTFGADSGPILNQVAFQYICKHNFYQENNYMGCAEPNHFPHRSYVCKSTGMLLD